MKRLLLLFSAYLFIQTFVNGQTSVNSGAWTTGSNWSGGAVPSGWTTIDVGHTLSRTGAYSVQGTLNVQSAGNLTLSGGDVTVTGGSTINVYGVLTITGNVTLNGYLRVFPGGKITVNGSVFVVDSDYLVVGTTAAPTPDYAQVVITQNLVSQGGGGDVRVGQNGRLAVFGNISGGSSGGTLITVDPGGMVFVNGTTTFTGGGDHLTNNNATSPYGFYSNNQPTYSGGGSDSNGAAGVNSVQNIATMQSEASSFYNWVSGLPSSPLPVVLLYFKVENIDQNGIMIRWATTLEQNFDYFLLERATSDLDFRPTATIPGRGGSNLKTSYHFEDRNPVQGKNYYRLKSIDIDGAYEYSSVIFGSWDGVNNGISIYPNPVTNQSLTLDLNDELTAPATVSLVEPRGHVIFTSTVDSSTSYLTIPDFVVSGIYFLKVSSSNGLRTIRIVLNGQQ